MKIFQLAPLPGNGAALYRDVTSAAISVSTAISAPCGNGWKNNLVFSVEMYQFSFLCVLKLRKE